MSRQGSSLAVAAAVIAALKRLPVLLRAAAAVVAVMAGLGITLAVAGWIKPVTQVQRTAHEAADSLVFSYSAQVPISPAYDGTRVKAPSPVFRKLAHLIDINMRYLGHPGTFSASLSLSASSGWQTTEQLLPPKAFSGTSHDAAVTLDLNTIDAKAKAAAKAIGIESDFVFVSIDALVKTDGTPPFTAPLRLTMSPLQLTLTGGTSLEVRGAGATADSTVVARVIHVLGHPLLTATRARAWSLLLLLVAAIGAIAIGLAVRNTAPVRSREEIERRFPQLLVHVEPMQSPPGKPVVNVDNFPALVKLAERYGQMILTWRRPDADDFVVRDEGITYRYRVPLDEPSLQNVELIDRPSGAGTHRRRAASEVS